MHAEFRDEEVVNDVLRDHDQSDGLVDRDVEIVDLRLSGRMLELPHPLFRHDVDVHGLGRHPLDVEVDPRGPYEKAHEHDERDDDPRHLDQLVLDHYRRNFSGGTATVLDGEDDDRQRDQERHERTESHQKEIERVDLIGYGRYRFGMYWEIFEQRSASVFPFFSKHQEEESAQPCQGRSSGQSDRIHH